MHKTLGFGLILSLLMLTACGPQSSSYTPTQDTISTTASITIDGSARIIHITDKGPSVQSETIDECVIGFDQEDLSYSFSSNDELTLNDQVMDYLRPLASAAELPGVDSRLFAVWGLPPQMVRQVSYTIEIEIQPSKLIYRNSCVM